MQTLDLSRQNITDNIHRLAAQKQLYFDGKRIFLWLLALTVPVTIVLSLAKVLLSQIWKIDIAWLTAGYGLLLSIAEYTIFQAQISARRSDAAKIQEAFDTSIYGMPWNEILCGKGPAVETINRFFRKFERRDKDGKRMQNLYDWYPTEADGLSLTKGILICQKTNAHYDFTLRERFLRLMYFVAGFTFLILLIFALVENLGIRQMLAQVGLPFLPLLTLTFKLRQDHSKSMKNLAEFKQNLDKLIDAESKKTAPTMDILRQIQDRIFHNRKDSPLIPEQFYDRLRKRLEQEMHDNAASVA
jgi:hypothetical protein